MTIDQISLGHSHAFLPRRNTLLALLVAAAVGGCAKHESGSSNDAAESAVVKPVQPDGQTVSPGSAPEAAEEIMVGASGTDPSPNIGVAPNPTDLELPLDQRPIDKEMLAKKRQELDESVWRNERLAQEYEQALVRLWDSLLAQERRADGNQFAVLAELGIDTIQIGTPGEAESLDWGIERRPLAESGPSYTQEEWKSHLTQLHDAGYRIEQSEWHHAQFDPDIDGAARSLVNLTLYALHGENQERLIVKGNVHVRWRAERSPENIPVPESIVTRDMEILRRVGPVPFEKILTVEHATKETQSGVQPVLVEDINGDGLSEIVLAGSNELLWNQGEGKFETEPLCTHPEQGFETGLLADMTGDGRLDYVLPGLQGDLLMYVADAEGRFSQPPIGKARGGGPLKQPQVITAGDIDADGDLDLWIGQYRISYVGGQMPSPYYDANDGFPAYLLLNNGEGGFTPATEEAGLAEKRYRRSYGGSFVDLDDDDDLDLVVISDFSGVDVYENNGKGYFTDRTEELLDNRHLFGMAATFADFNNDGRLDFFATGMASTTARRLDYMKLGRRDRPDIHMMRQAMAYGNRMYLAGDEGFVEPDFKNDVARTGWTWGTTSFDFDNDGDVDLFAANGHSSGESTKDHCTYFWCHDIYDASSEASKPVHDLFRDVHAKYFDRSESWDGYQKNALLMNQNGTGFVSIGYLMGVAEQFDGRAVISDDVDNDGRVDLIVAEDRWSDGQRLHVYRNNMPTAHHWIGIRLATGAGKRSPIGAKIRVETDHGVRIKHVLNGDSIHAQHAAVAHFGLGSSNAVTAYEVRWPDGHVTRVDHPEIDRYHHVGE